MGFGNVGYYFADFASKAGFKVVAVSDSKGGIIKRDAKGNFIPLDIPLVYDCKMEKGSLNGCYCAGGVCDMRGGQMITNEELLQLPVDILVPAALENVITENNMQNIKAKIIVEEMTHEYMVGEVLKGEVVKVADFGAFVRLNDFIDGMVHISEIAPWRVENVGSIIKEGMIVPVKIINIDLERGRIGLSIKEADKNFFSAKGGSASGGNN